MLPNDMVNYMEYHIMGKVSQVRMKPGCMPTKFECQEDRKKRTCRDIKRPYILKKQRRQIIAECLKEREQCMTSHTSSSSTKDISTSSVSTVSTVHVGSNIAMGNTQGENSHVSHDTEQQMAPHHQDHTYCCTVMKTTQEPLIEQYDFQHDIDETVVVKTEYVDVTEESEANQVTSYGEGNDHLKLYEDHEIKEELVIGPTVVQGTTGRLKPDFE